MIFVWTSRVSSRHFRLSRMSFTCFGSRYVREIGLEGSWRVGLCEVERNIFHLKLIQSTVSKAFLRSMNIKPTSFPRSNPLYQSSVLFTRDVKVECWRRKPD